MSVPVVLVVHSPHSQLVPNLAVVYSFDLDTCRASVTSPSSSSIKWVCGRSELFEDIARHLGVGLKLLHAKL